MTGPEVVVAGAFVVDCIADSTALPGWNGKVRARQVRLAAGGNALNIAIGLARLGVRAKAFGVVGDDDAGRIVLAALERENVDRSLMRVRAGVATPICMCFTNEADTAFVWNIDERISLSTADIDSHSAVINSAAMVVATYELSPAALSGLAAIAGRVVIHPSPMRADVSLPADKRLIALVPNESEARAMLGGAPGVRAAELPGLLSAAVNAESVIVTLGGQGCAVAHGGITTHYPAHPAAVVDTMGASDAFTAALVAALVTGQSVPIAVGRAQRAAAWSVGRPGGYESMPAQDVPR